jgi:hypothetical protein
VTATAPVLSDTVPVLSELLYQVRVEEPSRWEGLDVFPLRHPNGHAPTCVLIDSLLERHEAEIGEISDRGAIPTIKVLNRSTLDALILDGTELHGAKQNRMVNVTIVAGARAETTIPVSCVEAGRWSYRSRRFSHAHRTVAGKLRNHKAHLAAERAAGGAPAPNQTRIWESVRGYVEKAAAPSATGALDDAFARHADRVEAIVSALRKTDAHGAIVALHGEIVAVDLFDHQATFRRAWPSLLRGHALDAALEDRQGSSPLRRAGARKRLQALAAAGSLEQRSVPGVGAYYTVRGPGLAGGVAMHRGRVVHVALFPALAGA